MKELFHGNDPGPQVPAVPLPFPSRPLLGLACGLLALLESQAWAQSYVALMEGQRALPLQGTFNTVPVDRKSTRLNSSHRT